MMLGDGGGGGRVSRIILYEGAWSEIAAHCRGAATLESIGTVEPFLMLDCPSFLHAFILPAIIVLYYH
jgi:hypothetical protein